MPYGLVFLAQNSRVCRCRRLLTLVPVPLHQRSNGAPTVSHASAGTSVHALAIRTSRGLRTRAFEPRREGTRRCRHHLFCLRGGGVRGPPWRHARRTGERSAMTLRSCRSQNRASDRDSCHTHPLSRHACATRSTASGWLHREEIPARTWFVHVGKRRGHARVDLLHHFLTVPARGTAPSRRSRSPTNRASYEPLESAV
jgi:hypothetical protein